MTTASGLKITDTQVGTGATPRPGQICVMHYTGWLYQNGAKSQKFDSSLDRGQPFEFPLAQRGSSPAGTRGASPHEGRRQAHPHRIASSQRRRFDRALCARPTSRSTAPSRTAARRLPGLFESEMDQQIQPRRSCSEMDLRSAVRRRVPSALPARRSTPCPRRSPAASLAALDIRDARQRAAERVHPARRGPSADRPIGESEACRRPAR